MTLSHSNLDKKQEIVISKKIITHVKVGQRFIFEKRLCRMTPSRVPALRELGMACDHAYVNLQV